MVFPEIKPMSIEEWLASKVGKEIKIIKGSDTLDGKTVETFLLHDKEANEYFMFLESSKKSQESRKCF